MMTEACIKSMNETIQLAASEGAHAIVLYVNPVTEQTIIVSGLPEGVARGALKAFVDSTEESKIIIEGASN